MRSSPRKVVAGLVAMAVVLAWPGGGVATAASDARPASSHLGRVGWRTYGHDIRHTFQGVTTLTQDTVSSLEEAWFFPTGDAVTANPILAKGTVYVGSWDGFFYAINARTGQEKWRYELKLQPAVKPVPGDRRPEDVTTTGGIVTSSAFYLPRGRTRPALVIFGGGFTLYALRARDGKPYWIRDLTGRPEEPPNPDEDSTRIFSSPVVVGNQVLVGVSPDGADGYRGYLASVRVRTGKLMWRFETDVDAKGRILNDGCNGVWSSPTIDRTSGLVFFDTADCDFFNNLPYSEAIIAVRYRTGKLAWVFKPKREDNGCDWDFGATPNLGRRIRGEPRFLGVGGKDGTYYSLAPQSGRLRWKTNVVFGGFSGGFIGSTAYDGTRVYGATALGDFGRFEGVGAAGCDPGNPADQPFQEPSLHAFDARTGEVVWQARQSQSFGSVAVAADMVFVCTALGKRVEIRDSATGTLVHSIPLPIDCWSGPVVAGNSVIFGTGTSEQPSPAGVYLYSAEGESPL